jgi:Polyketide cyclase / dehydrase and lipid transport
MAGYFTMSQTIARPIDQVFRTATRLDQFPQWSPCNPWAKKLTDGEIREGTRFQMGIRGFGKVTNELHEFQLNTRVMVVPLSKMFDGGHRWMFTDLGDGSTRIDHELEMRPKGVFKLMGPMLRANGTKTVKETAAALQRHLEGNARS